MKLVPALATAALLGLCACDQIENDPDIKEARTAVENAIDDEGEGLKQVYNEARATKEAQPEEQNTDESQEGR